MISVTQAKQLVEINTMELPPINLPLQEAEGMVLAADVFANLDMPPFRQSAMDGYAFIFADLHPDKPFTVSGEMQAGAEQPLEIKPGQAIRIYTGAPIPAGADTVVMQEKVKLQGNKISLLDPQITVGRNVRPIGSEIKKGMLALAKGRKLTPAAIGFLAGIGTTEVKVVKKPSIALIVTGKELQSAGKELGFGQIYESNSFMLKSALHQLHFSHIKTFVADDKLEVLTAVLKDALEQSDLVILTGGVSVGDYDFVVEAAGQCAVETVFHRVKQKPGKPLYFGKMKEKIVFGLPGNPSSVLSCFYQYVIPALQKLSAGSFGNQIQARMKTAYQKNAGLTHFLKGYYDGTLVEYLDAQESYRLSSFARANCLIRLEEDQTECKAGDTVSIYLLPE